VVLGTQRLLSSGARDDISWHEPGGRGLRPVVSPPCPSGALTTAEPFSIRPSGCPLPLAKQALPHMSFQRPATGGGPASSSQGRSWRGGAIKRGPCASPRRGLRAGGTHYRTSAGATASVSARATRSSTGSKPKRLNRTSWPWRRRRLALARRCSSSRAGRQLSTAS